MTGSDPIAWLLGLERFGIKLGLDTIRTLRDALHDPDRAFTSVLIAGTNGKGSVAAMVERGLRAAGRVTGLYTSPHLIDLTERIRIDGRPIDRAALAAEADRLRDMSAALRRARRLRHPPTFFETITAAALALFRQRGVETAVIEVGLGGRCDATNVVTPAAVAIPSIDLDHQQHLGATLADIAAEKAGVIKAGTVVVNGEAKPAARAVLQAAAAGCGARFIDAHADVAVRARLDAGVTRIEAFTTPEAQYGPLTLALRGRHQIGNAAVAVRVLEALAARGLRIPRAAIRQALTAVRWRGRLDLVDAGAGRQLLLDPAHNVAAAAALGAYVAEVHPAGLPFVFGALRDKDAAGMLRALGRAATRIVCAPIDTPRALPPAALADLARAARPDLPVAEAASPAAAIEAVLDAAPLAAAAGSVYLVGDLLRTLDR